MDLFDHISLKVGEAGVMSAFLTAALAPLDIERKFVVDRPGGVVAGFGRHRSQLFVIGGSDPTPPIHLAFQAQNRAAVDAFHAAALSAGGQDNGAPGVRLHYHPDYYAAFVIDPAGNNIEAVCHQPQD